MNTPDDIHHALQALHEPLPPASLWTQVRAARQRQLRRRRSLAASVSTGLVLALCVVMLRPWTPPQPSPQTATQAVTDPAGRHVDERVRALDRALQAAYDRGASDAEVAPMWEARHALLASTHAPRGCAGDINDI